jgi:hypothetical protein
MLDNPRCENQSFERFKPNLPPTFHTLALINVDLRPGLSYIVTDELVKTLELRNVESGIPDRPLRVSKKLKSLRLYGSQDLGGGTTNDWSNLSVRMPCLETLEIEHLVSTVFGWTQVVTPVHGCVRIFRVGIGAGGNDERRDVRMLCQALQANIFPALQRLRLYRHRYEDMVRQALREVVLFPVLVRDSGLDELCQKLKVELTLEESEERFRAHTQME